MGIVKIDDRPIDTPRLTPEEVRVKSVNSIKVDPKSKLLTPSERRKKKDRRKKQLNWHGKFDMRSGKDRRRGNKPSIDIDV